MRNSNKRVRSAVFEEHPAGLFGLVSAEGGTNSPREKKLRPPESEHSGSEKIVERTLIA